MTLYKKVGVPANKVGVSLENVPQEKTLHWCRCDSNGFVLDLLRQRRMSLRLRRLRSTVAPAAEESIDESSP